MSPCPRCTRIARALLASAVAALLTLVSSQARDLSPNEPIIWAHALNVFPLDLDLLRPYRTLFERNLPFGPDHPLEMGYNWQKSRGVPWIDVDIQRAKAAGIDGFAVNVFSDGNAFGYWDAADRTKDFSVAPCLDFSGVPSSDIVQVATRMILRHCREAPRHPSAACVNGAPVFFTFGRSMTTPTQWAAIRRNIQSAGQSFYLIGDVGLAEPGFSQASLEQYLRIFDAAYNFGGPGEKEQSVRAIAQKADKPYVATVTPGYYRPGAGYVPADCTAHFRDQWRTALDSSSPWICVITWNDFAEETQVMPSASYGFTRSLVNDWYASRHTHEPASLKTPQLFVTSPACILPGQFARVEALVLNPMDTPLQIGLRISRGGVVSEAKSAAVPPFSEQSITTEFTPSKTDVGMNTFAIASIALPARKNDLSSAPIAILDPSTHRPRPVRYFSRSLRDVDAAPCRLRLKSDARGVPRLAEIEAPPDARFVELLKDGAAVSDFISGPPYRVALPVPQSFGSSRGGSPYGSYCARVIDQDYRIGYSPEVFAPAGAPPGILENYAIASHRNAWIDASPFRRGARMRDVLIKRRDGPPAFALFNGKSSRIDLEPELTPRAPFELVLMFRNDGKQGTLFADTGGIVLGLDGAGHVVLQIQHSGGGWATATSPQRAPAGIWSEVRATVRPGTIALSLNRAPAVDRPWRNDGLQSGVRALGCNPFGGGSGYFTGGISIFRITRLPGD